MEPAVRPLVQLLELNTDLLLNCLQGVPEADALARPLPGANNISFLACHITDARHFMAQLLARPAENPLQATLGEVRTIDEATTLPTLAALSTMWISVAAHVSLCLEAASGDLLASRPEHSFPMPEQTVLCALAFLVQHESYHLGQMAMLRRALGHDAMSYLRAAPTLRD